MSGQQSCPGSKKSQLDVAPEFEINLKAAIQAWMSLDNATVPHQLFQQAHQLANLLDHIFGFIRDLNCPLVVLTALPMLGEFFKHIISWEYIRRSTLIFPRLIKCIVSFGSLHLESSQLTEAEKTANHWCKSLLASWGIVSHYSSMDLVQQNDRTRNSFYHVQIQQIMLETDKLLAISRHFRQWKHMQPSGVNTLFLLKYVPHILSRVIAIEPKNLHLQSIRRFLYAFGKLSHYIPYGKVRRTSPQLNHKQKGYHPLKVRHKSTLREHYKSMHFSVGKYPNQVTENMPTKAASNEKRKASLHYISSRISGVIDALDSVVNSSTYSEVESLNKLKSGVKGNRKSVNHMTAVVQANTSTPKKQGIGDIQLLQHAMLCHLEPLFGPELRSLPCATAAELWLSNDYMLADAIYHALSQIMFQNDGIHDFSKETSHTKSHLNHNIHIFDDTVHPSTSPILDNPSRAKSNFKDKLFHFSLNSASETSLQNTDVQLRTCTWEKASTRARRHSIVRACSYSIPLLLQIYQTLDELLLFGDCSTLTRIALNVFLDGTMTSLLRSKANDECFPPSIHLLHYRHLISTNRNSLLQMRLPIHPSQTNSASVLGSTEDVWLSGVQRLDKLARFVKSAFKPHNLDKLKPMSVSCYSPLMTYITSDIYAELISLATILYSFYTSFYKGSVDFGSIHTYDRQESLSAGDTTYPILLTTTSNNGNMDSSTQHMESSQALTKEISQLLMATLHTSGWQSNCYKFQCKQQHNLFQDRHNSSSDRNDNNSFSVNIPESVGDADELIHTNSHFEIDKGCKSSSNRSLLEYADDVSHEVKLSKISLACLFRHTTCDELFEFMKSLLSVSTTSMTGSTSCHAYECPLHNPNTLHSTSSTTAFCHGDSVQPRCSFWNFWAWKLCCVRWFLSFSDNLYSVDSMLDHLKTVMCDQPGLFLWFTAIIFLVSLLLDKFTPQRVELRLIQVMLLLLYI